MQTCFFCSGRLFSFEIAVYSKIVALSLSYSNNNNMSHQGNTDKKSSGTGGTGGGGGGGPRKESIMELAKMMDSSVRVKVLGGREFVGMLRGYDDLVNLVLDGGVEYVRGTLEKKEKRCGIIMFVVVAVVTTSQTTLFVWLCDSVIIIHAAITMDPSYNDDCRRSHPTSLAPLRDHHHSS
jgi:small nuclear ribonucleoprotein (snRNP)-like protein